MSPMLAGGGAHRLDPAWARRALFDHGPLSAVVRRQPSVGEAVQGRHYARAALPIFTAWSPIVPWTAALQSLVVKVALSSPAIGAVSWPFVFAVLRQRRMAARGLRLLRASLSKFLARDSRTWCRNSVRSATWTTRVAPPHRGSK
jgi:hypothetical protein